MNMKTPAVIVGLVLAGCASKPTPSEPSSGVTTHPTSAALAADRVPEGWQTEYMVYAVYPGKQGDCLAHVLAWKVQQNQHLYDEECLLWLRCKSDAGGNRWALAHLFRHPKEHSDRYWNSAQVVSGKGGESRATMEYDHPPTNQEIYAFCDQDLAWSWRPSDGFTLVDSGVCAQRWTTLTGQKPTKQFEPVPQRP